MISAEHAGERLAYMASLMPEIRVPSRWWYFKRWMRWLFSPDPKETP